LSVPPPSSSVNVTVRVPGATAFDLAFENWIACASRATASSVGLPYSATVRLLILLVSVPMLTKPAASP
jgi:hypothetical protein